MNARRIARAGVMVALLAVSAQVMLPVVPVPFTLQTLVLAMMPAALDRVTANTALVAYVLLGACGLPVFSGFGGGAAALLGPTGGFLWGFMLGNALAGRLYSAAPQRLGAYGRSLAAAALMLFVSYVCGTVQLTVLMSLDVFEALAIAVIPFIIPDLVKICIGARLGCTIGRVLTK